MVDDVARHDVRVSVSGLASVHSYELFMRLLDSRDPGRPKVTVRQCRLTLSKSG